MIHRDLKPENIFMSFVICLLFRVFLKLEILAGLFIKEEMEVLERLFLGVLYIFLLSLCRKKSTMRKSMCGLLGRYVMNV